MTYGCGSVDAVTVGFKYDRTVWRLQLNRSGTLTG